MIEIITQEKDNLAVEKIIGIQLRYFTIRKTIFGDDYVDACVSWNLGDRRALIRTSTDMFYRWLFDNVLKEYEHKSYDRDGDLVYSFRVDSWEEWETKLPLHYKQGCLITFLESKYPNSYFTRFSVPKKELEYHGSI